MRRAVNQFASALKPDTRTTLSSERPSVRPVLPWTRHGMAPAFVGFAVLLLVLLAVSIADRWHLPWPQCAFQAMTGLPCLTCGTTRSLLALGRFDLMRSFQFNPLAALVCISIIGWFAFVLFNRIVPIRLSPPFNFNRTRVLILLGIAGIV